MQVPYGGAKVERTGSLVGARTFVWRHYFDWFAAMPRAAHQLATAQGFERH